MRILWSSNARTAPTGYGNQTNIFVPALQSKGHEMAIFAYYGQEGFPMKDQDGILTLPRLSDSWGNDIILGHMDYHQAELLITLCDPFVLDPNAYGRVPWAAWTPIDSVPALPANVAVLQHARWIWAMSKFGQGQLEAAGLGSKITYVPHGVDTETFKPISRSEARQRLGKYLGADLDDKFLVVINSANKGAPSRKGFYEMFSAFKMFSDDHPRAMLYVHSDRKGIWMGENLDELAALVGLDPAKVLIVPEYPYHMGMLPGKYLNDVYNAGDVLLQLSHGEGFGIPILEAQASGCPVIVTDFSAMSELCFAGLKVRGRPFMHVPGATQHIADVTMAVACLNLLHEYVRNGMGEGMRAKARDGAMAYDYRKVLDEYMLPALHKIQQELAGAADKKLARAAKRKAVRDMMGAASGA